MDNNLEEVYINIKLPVILDRDVLNFRARCSEGDLVRIVVQKSIMALRRSLHFDLMRCSVPLYRQRNTTHRMSTMGDRLCQDLQTARAICANHRRMMNHERMAIVEAHEYWVAIGSIVSRGAGQTKIHHLPASK